MARAFRPSANPVGALSEETRQMFSPTSSWTADVLSLSSIAELVGGLDFPDYPQCISRSRCPTVVQTKPFAAGRTYAASHQPGSA